MTSNRKNLWAVFALIITVFSGWQVAAQDTVKARILILFDTSGSMTWTIAGDKTYGDGSADALANGRYCCPGTGDSRLAIAKEAMTKMVDATGDIEFALMKFPQAYDPDQANGQPARWYSNNQTIGQPDVLRYRGIDGVYDSDLDLYDYSGIFANQADYICEGFAAGNATEIEAWFDNREYDTDLTPLASPFDSPLGPSDQTEQELRADGGTPLGEAVNAAYHYIQQAQQSDTNPRAACRPWYLLILADGDYDGYIQPVTGDDLNGGPAQKGVDDLHDELGVDTWVVGLAASSTTLDEMADVGGCHFDPNRPLDRTAHAASDCTGSAGHAFLANTKESLTNILYHIISSSILSENQCDGIDNDCDGQIDEGFDLYCNWDGVNPSTAPTPDLCVDPGESACDGVDNNCNGQVDEGTWPDGGLCGGGPVNFDVVNYPYTVCEQGTMKCVPGSGMRCVGSVTPELTETCNGFDDDCDGLIDEDASNSGNYTMTGGSCGTDLGVCSLGTLTCSVTGWQCIGDSPGTEVCDGTGQDENCNGQVDETFPGAGEGCYTAGDNGCATDGTSCVGACQGGVWICDTTGNQVCSGELSAATDDSVCNGIDDDCDGLTDEDVVEGGICPDQASSWVFTGSSQCQAGTWQCQGNQGLVCVGTVVSPQAEVCDGLDNDCDGVADEDLFGACGGCTGPDCTADPGEGACRVGIGQCNPATSSVGNPDFSLNCSDQGPVQEVCDGKDNDCDGLTDEDDPDMTALGAACYPSGLFGCNSDGTGCKGLCAAGTEQCVNGVVRCEGYTGPVPEGTVCDDLDNNCNGQIDEGITNSCGDPINTTLFPGAAYGVGICRLGVQYCSTGVTGSAADWGPCEGAQGPRAELCNGVDDDCDGLYENNELADLLANNDSDPNTLDSLVGTTCGTCDGKYECQLDTAVASGPIFVDTPGAYHLVCVGPQIGVEVCNGEDENCNGVADDGIAPVPCGGCTDTANWDCIDTDPGAGECQVGFNSCVDGAMTTECFGAIGPVAEKCDGLDNDCDGLTDETLPLVGTSCQQAQGACGAGVYQCVFSGSVKSMMCCDETVWNNGGGCVLPTLPQQEVCDGVDNDCDGLTDNGLVEVGQPCGSSLGICTPGHYECDTDSLGQFDILCVGESTGTTEECNGLDDDCDGLIDEDIASGGPCNNTPGWMTDAQMQADFPNGIGVCTTGELLCVNGTMKCNAPKPTDEICDGLDNNCNGEADDGLEVTCPVEGTVCVQGQCAERCSIGEFSCPPGKECVDVGSGEMACVSNLCDPKSNDALPCVFNKYYCTEGQGFEPPCECSTQAKMCTDACFGKICDEGFYCVAADYGRCHPLEEGCVVTGCPDGQRCEAIEPCVAEPCYQCAADPCSGVTCSDGEYCNLEGNCVATCEGVECPDGAGCVDGACVDGAACAGVVCDVGVACNPATGQCDASLSNPCAGIACKFYETCKAGACVFDSCFNVNCPNGTMCVDGSCYEPKKSATVVPGTSDTETGSGGGALQVDTESTTGQVDTDDHKKDLGLTDTGPTDYKGIDDILASGSGGCLCTVTPGREQSVGPGQILLLLLGALVIFRRRR